MTRREDFKVLLSVANAGVVAFSACTLTFLSLDRVIGPGSRGTDFDFLFLPAIVAIFAASGYLWWKTNSAVLDWLDKRL